MYDQSHIGRRVTYTDRNGNTHQGTIRGIAEGTKFADVNLDGARRPVNYLPFDTLRLNAEEK